MMSTIYSSLFSNNLSLSKNMRHIKYILFFNQILSETHNICSNNQNLLVLETIKLLLFNK